MNKIRQSYLQQRSLFQSFLFLAALLFLIPPLTYCMAGEKPENQSGSSATRFSLHAAAIYQPESDLDSGGSISVSRYLFRLNASRRINSTFTIGAGVYYDYDDYDFSAQPAFAGLPPWDDIIRLGVSLPLSFTIADDWHLTAAPSFEFSYENGAEWQDGVIAGGVVSLSHTFNRRLVLGGGFGAFNGLEETYFFPYLVIFWQMSDQWRLANPLRVGPAGPAGLELSFAINHDWELGTGIAYRSYRFRLDRNGIAAGGVGHAEFFPIWGRISKKIASRYKLDLYLGAALGAEVSVDDHTGRKIAKDHHKPSALLAFSLAATF